MPLTLEVTGPQAASLGAASRKVFDAAGGTIGRLADNTWALPDPYVSSRHAVIRYRDGTYYIEDTSTNGVYVNSPDHPLVKGQPYALKSGDWILIEPYEIRASITSDAPKSAPSFDSLFGTPASPPAPPPRIPDDPFGEPFAPPPPVHGRGPSIPSGRDIIPESISDSQVVDPLDLLGLEPKRQPPPSVPSAADLGRRSVLSDHYQAPHVPAAPSPPPAARPGGLIPKDYNPLAPDDSSDSVPVSPPRPAPAPPKPAHEVPRPASRAVPPPTSAPRPAPPVTPPPAKPEPRRQAGMSGGDLAAVLAGAGLENVAVTPELARSFGHILRVVVSGVMDVLQARQRIKQEFRLDMTMFKPADNNPLKFSANVDDALHNLLVKRNPAYLGPVDAFEDAFDDVRNHQMAMLAGVRVAFESMLAAFDPDRLQEEFEHQLKKGGGLLAMGGRGRYWDLYRDKIHDMVRDPEKGFRELFGDEFAKAYEEQLRRLKAQGRADQS
jgi:type VI secretion system FHA domain protein